MTLRKEYTAEFKREAVQLVEQRGNLAAVARELGIHSSMIYRWRHQLQDNGLQAFPGKGNPQDAELARLQRELRRVQEENAILKKAVGIFSIPPR